MKKIITALLAIILSSHSYAITEEEASDHLFKSKFAYLCADMNLRAGNRAEYTRLHEIWLHHIKDYSTFNNTRIKSLLTPTEETLQQNKDFQFGRSVGVFGAYANIETTQILQSHQAMSADKTKNKAIISKLIQDFKCEAMHY